MKKILTAIITGSLMLSLVACSDKSTEYRKADTSAQNTIQVEEEIQEPETSTPVTMDQLPINLVILQPNSIGTRYMEATYTNNSEYAVTGYKVTVLLKDQNKKTYLTSYDTVMPGETSPTFKTFAPDTGNPEDIEYLEYYVKIVDAQGKETRIEYNTKLGTYDCW